MGDAKRRRKANQPINIPISDNPEISETAIYPTIEAMFIECIASKPWFDGYSPGIRRTIKFAFYGAVSEALRTIAFRMNADQNESVFTDFDRELRAYDRELQRQVEQAGAELH